MVIWPQSNSRKTKQHNHPDIRSNNNNHNSSNNRMIPEVENRFTYKQIGRVEEVEAAAVLAAEAVVGSSIYRPQNKRLHRNKMTAK